ncbi:hypothetical protein A8C56_02950 [Niabella ginsenosidivorans]|uniref:Uncharacterized protein n=1 Tax=Niabella ginsenosidivorans TaxID=1176587 RepID=A0A1A9HZ53_9BACT|nr:hypothetical protein [Niabella ginsenosidivorans]ANH80079.1 hypothetical protein A8C56_02950 [Niabella ginsenosidivorans]
MADTWNIKYQMLFKDILGEQYRVDFRHRTYSGDITQLTGSASPVAISTDGDENEAMDPIRQTKATINILMPRFNIDLYNDITSGEDQDLWVEIIRSGEVFTSGWLLPDQIQRSFDEYNFNISILVTSPFAIMKGQQLLNDSGIMLFRQQSLKIIIETALSRSLPSIVEPIYEIYSDYTEADSSGVSDLFEDLKVIMEGFNDDGGKPPYCYDMLEKTMLSFGFYCIWENNKLKILDPFYSDSRQIKSIFIKTHDINRNILLGNTESITKVYTSKEISSSYDYGRASGLLTNGRFVIYDQNTGLFPYWSYADAVNDSGVVVRSYNASTVVRVGSGRPIDPYAMRLIGDGGPDVSSITSNEPVNQGIWDDAYFKADDNVNLSIKFRYQDYKTKYGISQNETKIPWLIVYVIFQDADINHPGGWPALKFAVDVQDLEYTNKSDQMHKVDYYKEVPFPSIVFAPNFEGQIYLPPKIFIGVDSTEDVQEYGKSLGKMPFDGYVTVQIMGAVWEDGQPVAIATADQFVDILEVILTKTTSVNGSKVTGEKTYLTQNGKYSIIEDTKQTYMGHFTNDGITGCLLKSDGTYSSGVYRGTASTTNRLQDWLLSSKMAVRRSPRYRVDADILTNEVSLSDLLSFRYSSNAAQSTDLIPGNYMIMHSNYDLKKAALSLTAYQLNPEYKPYRSKIMPDENNDMYENFKTTSSGNT